MKQEKLAHEQENIINKLYINYNKRNKKNWETEGLVMIFKHANEKVPFSKQTPIDILTIKQLKENYGIDIINKKPEEDVWM